MGLTSIIITNIIISSLYCLLFLFLAETWVIVWKTAVGVQVYLFILYFIVVFNLLVLPCGLYTELFAYSTAYKYK